MKSREKGIYHFHLGQGDIYPTSASIPENTDRRKILVENLRPILRGDVKRQGQTMLTN
jgi:hypothetical protein